MDLLICAWTLLSHIFCVRSSSFGLKLTTMSLQFRPNLLEIVAFTFNRCLISLLQAWLVGKITPSSPFLVGLTTAWDPQVRFLTKPNMLCRNGKGERATSPSIFSLNCSCERAVFFSYSLNFFRHILASLFLGLSYKTRRFFFLSTL